MVENIMHGTFTLFIRHFSDKYLKSLGSHSIGVSSNWFL